MQELELEFEMSLGGIAVAMRCAGFILADVQGSRQRHTIGMSIQNKKSEKSSRFSRECDTRKKKFPVRYYGDANSENEKVSEKRSRFSRKRDNENVPCRLARRLRDCLLSPSKERRRQDKLSDPSSRSQLLAGHATGH